MGEVISIREAYRVRRRRQRSALNARCRQVIAESLESWRAAYAVDDGRDGAICLQRIRVLGELLAVVDRHS